MSTQLAFASAGSPLAKRFRLPPAIPPFNTTTLRLFSLLWFLAFMLALAGPIAGFYLRYTAPSNNSQLLLGSRAGFAVSPRDATMVRFTVGPDAKNAGIVAGDKIVAVYGVPLPPSMPMNEAALAAHQEDPAYIVMGNLLYGTDEAEVPLTVRDPNGRTRDVTVTTGEHHIAAGAKALGISTKLLSFIDLLPVLAYPFLLWAAWMLHRRNSRDVVSSILSIAVLFTIAAEQPSSVFLAYVGVPRWLNVALYDSGNVMLLAGILLFPHGHLSWRIVGLLAALPLLLFLQGQVYQTFFVGLLILAVLLLLRCLRKTESGEMRQQIRWALLGFTGYALLHGLSITADYLKWSTDSFGHQLLVELMAGLCFAFGVIILQFGLLIALLRYRLYDADVAISRSANFALITLSVAAIFAAAQDIVKQIVYNYSGNSNSEGPVIFAAALATMLVNPIQERIQRWSERRFQQNLFILRDDLPESVRDLRETASLEELLSDILRRIEQGVRSVRSAFIVDGRIMDTHDVTQVEVEEWRAANQGYSGDLCEPNDKMFPLRIELIPSSEKDAEPIGYILVGPRPDGSIPSKEEQKTLAGVSETIARAIRTVIKREKRERDVAETIEATNRRIDALEALLRGPSLKRSPGKA
ncbi:MAG: hypothetical protein V4513_06370 [Pseudomonadota bacterium]